MPARSPPPPRDGRPLSERWRPIHLTDMVGNPRAVRALKSWASDWQSSAGTPPRYRAALLEGPPGVGKTSSALALASDMGWSVVEMNASDARNQDSITEVAGRASMTNTLGEDGVYRGRRGGARTLILLDEADCLSGRATEESAHRTPTQNFREFLRGRYHTVDALTKAWKLGTPGAPPAFEGWESIPTTAGRGAWTKLPLAQRDIADWRGSGKPRDSSDRGGLAAIARLVRETRQPLLLTVNDAKALQRYSPVFKQGVKHLQFSLVSDDEVRAAVGKVLAAERIVLSAPLLEAVLRRSHGDLRAAFTDLEAVAALPDAASAEALLGARDSSGDKDTLVAEVFGHPRFYRSLEIRDLLDTPPDDLFPWIEENLPRAAVDPLHRYEAFEVANRAELFLHRARRHRVWSLWPFATELMTGGVSIALSDGSPPRTPQVAFPVFLSQMGQSRARRATRLSLTVKVGGRLHVSRRKAIDAFLPFLDRLYGAPTPEAGARATPSRRVIARQLGLSNEEIAYLLGANPDDEAVAALGAVPEAPETPPDPEAPEDVPAPTVAAPTVPASTEPPKQVQRRLGEF